MGGLADYFIVTGRSGLGRQVREYIVCVDIFSMSNVILLLFHAWCCLPQAAFRSKRLQNRVVSLDRDKLYCTVIGDILHFGSQYSGI